MGCVVASRIKQYKPDATVLVIEAGSDTRGRTDILQPQTLNLGGELDWQFQTEPMPTAFNRTLVYNQGKALGGGSCINSGKIFI